MTLRHSLILAAGVGLALAVACDRSPARPSPPPSTPPTPAATTTRLELSGPATVPPGGTAQFAVLAHRSDGSTRDVTSIAAWQVSSSNVLSVSAGVATGRNRGDATIIARYAEFSAIKSVIVLPTGTFRLSGVIQETAPPIGPIPAVRVEVADGVERGLSINSAPDGSFRLYGVTGEIELRLSKAGYTTRTERLTVTEHQSLQLGLAIITPLPDLSGRYGFTIQAADTCDQPAAELLERRYTAEIVQAGPRATVTLGGATFPPVYYGQANRFSGTVEPTQARFLLAANTGFYYYYGPSLLERLTPTRFYAAVGTLTFGLGSGSLIGDLDGTVDIREGPSLGRLTVASSCKSTRHRVTLTR